MVHDSPRQSIKHLLTARHFGDVLLPLPWEMEGKAGLAAHSASPANGQHRGIIPGVPPIGQVHRHGRYSLHVCDNTCSAHQRG